MHNIIEINKAVARMPEFRLKEPADVVIPADTPLAIVGLNASGKTLLVDMLTGAHPLLGNEIKYDFSPSASNKASQNIKVVTFRDAYGSTGGDFYQLRWNHGLQEDSATVKDILKTVSSSDMLSEELSQVLGLEPLLEKKIIMLSSGELRRVQLAEVLQSAPRLLFIDNPYIGLDVNARKQTSDFLTKVAEKGKSTLVLIVSREKDIPDFIQRILPVSNGKVYPICDKKDFLAHLHKEEKSVSYAIDAERRNAILSLPDHENAANGSPVVECNNINISYGSRDIFKDFSWTVKSGERWALNGENGAGKSTLLSLVCADNPRAYACNISLFGCKRGTGESIWDIKKKIGYVSPEMFRSYRRNMSVLKIAASGLSDTNGIYNREIDDDAREKVMFWLNIFGIGNISDKNYLQLSSGEQRLVLLARAFVKDPELLVLDEPFHGLDRERRELSRSIIDTFCSRKGKTLIMVTHYEEEYPSTIDHRLRLKKLG